MGRASFNQTSFLGGEWAPEAQGRADRPDYRTALALCQNTIPVEAGANVRRSGTEWLAKTYGRGAAKLLAFVPSTTAPCVGEYCGGTLRFFLGTSLIFTTDAPQTISVAAYSGTNFDLTIGAAGAFADGDQVMLYFPAGLLTPDQEAGLRNQVLTIVLGGGTTTIRVGDDIGGSLSGYTLPAGGLVGAQVYRVLRLGTSYNGNDLPNLRVVQAGNTQLVLVGTHAPQIVTQTSAPTAGYTSGLDDRLYMVTRDPTTADYAVELLRPLFGQTGVLTDAWFVDRGSGIRAIVQAGFSIGAAAFVDGPYNKAQADAGTVSGGTGTPTFTPVASTFTAADVGRHIRLFSQPPAWASGTTYANGALVTYNNTYWQSNAGSNTGNTPGTTPLVSGAATVWWSPAPAAAVWAWGTIATQAGTSCTVTLADASGSGGAQGTIPTAANGFVITTWQLGTFTSGSYPTCGAYHEGRLWLAGAVGNRFDSGMSNVSLQFSPTDKFGNVNDNNAISQTLNSPAIDQIVWVRPDHQGLLLGSLGGEFLVAATNQNELMTPTSIQAHKVTQYGCAFIEPIRTGAALVFVQRYGRRVLEYLSDTFSGRFTGKHLNELALHLSSSGIAEIVYNEEPNPVVWCRMNDGSLNAITYRRVSRFVTEAPVFNAWHRHIIGG